MADNGSRKQYTPGLFDRARGVPFEVVLRELELLDGAKQKGDEIGVACPWCGDEKSFSANAVNGKSNCKRCKHTGSVIDFVAERQQIKPVEAVHWILSLAPPAQEPEVEDEMVSTGLTDREVRLMELMARAFARYMGIIFSAIADEKMEAIAWKAVRQEIAEEFPDTVLPE
jgi:hypothetical protein